MGKLQDLKLHWDSSILLDILRVVWNLMDKYIQASKSDKTKIRFYVRKFQKDKEFQLLYQLGNNYLVYISFLLFYQLD